MKLIQHYIKSYDQYVFLNNKLEALNNKTILTEQEG